ncbi:MAG: hypothetical protein KDK70_43610, partial [Myxococcales bacterium]|nr:hypothetical protein [Myxococcales bacterium]
MRRVHLVEIHEQTWCPRVLRDGLTDFLQLGMRSLDMFGQAVPLVQRALERTGAARVVDLCAGGGGPWLRLSRQLGASDVQVLLTDKFPSASALRRVQGSGREGLA